MSGNFHVPIFGPPLPVFPVGPRHEQGPPSPPEVPSPWLAAPIPESTGTSVPCAVEERVPSKVQVLPTRQCWGALSSRVLSLLMGFRPL